MSPIDDAATVVSPRPRAWLRRPLDFPLFAQLLVLLVATGLACLSPAQGDTWWQLRAGRDIWRTGRVPLHDTYSWTVPGSEWPNHSWLWQALAWGLTRVGGMPLLTLATALACLGAVALSVPRRPTRLSVIVLCGALPLLAGVWSLRPQAVSLLMLGLLLALLRAERFAWLPLVMLLWANLHAAVAVGGVALVGACLGAAALFAIRRDDESRRRALLLPAATALSAVAALATPLGWRLWTFVPQSIERSKTSQIQEWGSALTWSPYTAWAGVWLAALVILLLVRRPPLGDWPVAVSLGVALVLVPFAASSMRNVPFLVLACLALLTVARGTTGAGTRLDDDVPGASTILAAMAVVIAAAVVTCWAQPLQRLAWHPVEPAAVAAVEGCEGPLYNTFSAGAYLIGFAPGVRVFVDNRQDPYPREILAFGVLTSAAQANRLEAAYGVRCAFVETDSISESSLRDAGWDVHYADEAWSVLALDEREPPTRAPD